MIKDEKAPPFEAELAPPAPADDRRLGPIQWSILQFLIPLVYAVTTAEYIVAFNLTMLVGIGLIVHREKRTNELDKIDLTDHIFIGSMFCANLYLSATIQNQVLYIAGWCWGFMTFFLAICRFFFPYQSTPRKRIHILMHFCGAMCTLNQLYGATRHSYTRCP